MPPTCAALSCTLVDLEPAMLAEPRLNQVRAYQGDMRSVRLGRALIASRA